MREFVGRYRRGVPWHQAGVRSAGNGALMRIAPMVYPHARSATVSLWSDAALAAMTTHNDNAAIASAIAFVAVLWDLLAMKTAPDPLWWRQRFLQVLRHFDDRTPYSPRRGAYSEMACSFSSYVEHVLEDSSKKGLSALEACESFYSRAYLLETVPCALYILQCHGSEPETAVVRAVNDTRDNDTIGATVGAAVGALHGSDALPERWVRKLSGRTRAADDGRMFEVLELSSATFLT